MQTLGESGQTLGEGMQKLEMLSRFPSEMKRALSEIKKLEAAYTKSQKSAAKLKIDVSAQLADFRKALDAIEAGYNTADAALKGGDADAASEALKSDVWENMQDAYQFPSIIEAIGNVRKSLTGFDKFIAKASKSKTVAADSDATAALADMRAKVAELKQSSGASADPEEIRSSLNDIFELQSTIQQAMGGGNFQGGQNGPTNQNGNSSFDFSAFGQASGSQGQR
jgi:predicted  nucleic acid-binding Zn-ribbon protein